MIMLAFDGLVRLESTQPDLRPVKVLSKIQTLPI